MNKPNLELPVHQTNQPLTRMAEDVRAMSVAAQANLVQLRVFVARRIGTGHLAFDHPVRSPGAVRSYRDALIDRDALKAYTPEQVLLCTHEVWGQHCLFQWVLDADSESASDADAASRSEPPELRCDAVLAVNLAEISGLFWRVRFEQRCRAQADHAKSAWYTEGRALAETIPAVACSKPVAEASDDEMLCTACEFVGMLSALRWIMDRRRDWGEPGIGEVGDRPF